MSAGTNSNTTSSNNALNASQSNKETADIQAQFELLVELRKFINIDLFQRGYYQVRLQLKCPNKQIPMKIMLQLEKNQNNQNLSDSMFPSNVIDDYAVSKTFLILYRNEEIILDDQILFKISTIVNAFNIVESFEKMDLQLSVELWFTENDYKPVEETSGSQKDTNGSSNVSLTSNSSSNGANSGGVQFNVNTNPSSNSGSNTNSTGTVTSNVMQLLCSRVFKVHFDPRTGIHIQIPVLFDYFHLSSVLCTVHCTLLTLLPPVMLGTSFQRNSTLTTILFGKDLSKFKPGELNDTIMKRAVFLHNQICYLLLSSYEHLQDHVTKMTSHLDQYKQKAIDKIDYVDCQEKMHKLSEIAEQCGDSEALDDLANRHVAQASAENIMQWGTYVDNFSLNQEIAPYLAAEYHNRRLKRFGETFFLKDFAKKNLNEYEINENYVSLNDTIRQSTYYNQLPELILSCDDLDGTADNIPVIFEDNYVSTLPMSSPSSSISSQVSSSESIPNKKSDNKRPFLRSFNSSLKNPSGISKQYNSSKELSYQGSNRKSSLSSNEYSGNSAHLTDSNKKLHRRLKKKLSNNGDCTDQTDVNSSIQLVSYKKVDNEVDLPSVRNVDNDYNTSKGSSASSLQSDTGPSTVQSKLSLIKAELAARGSTSNINRVKNLHSITEQSHHGSSVDNPGEFLNNKRRTLVKQQTHEVLLGNTQESGSDEASLRNDVKESCKSLNNLTCTEREFQSELYKKQINDSALSMNNNESENDSTLDLENIAVALEDKLNDNSLNEPETNTNNQTEPSTEAGNNNTPKFAKNKILTNLIPETDTDIDSSEPSDGSFKSRALYESFRGKPSTLDRPKPKKRISSLGNNTSLSSTPNNHHARINKRISYEEFLSDVNKPSEDSDDQQQKGSSVHKPHSMKDKKKPLSTQLSVNTDKNSLSTVTYESIYKFALLREDFKKIVSLKYHGNIYSEMSSLFCTGPYFYAELTPKLKPSPSFDRHNKMRASFISTLSSKTKRLFKSIQQPEQERSVDCESIKSDDINDSVYDEERLHLVVCVHGLDGNSGDLRLVRTYLELALPGAKIDFLMSEHNQDNTFDDLEVMTKGLIKEINDYIEVFGIDPERISFVGHSLGNLIVRSTVAHEDFKPFIGKLHTYLSLSGPHLGTLYNSSGLINMGMWIMQKWKKSGSLLQLSLKDHPDLQKTFLFKLSTRPTFEHFKNILLVASPQDRYVPFHSARIEMCKAAIKDNLYGAIYREMVSNILKPIKSNPNITFKRYSAFHSLSSGTNNFIGRAAHIAVLDSELFVEKLVLVSVAKYFR